MIAGIYYGAQFGGSTTSILVNIPGEASSVVTCLDGYEMTKKGRAGAALGISAYGSFIGGTISVVAVMFLATPMAEVALRFGSPEYFAIMCMGLILVVYLAQKSIIKGLIMAAFGMALGSIGMDIFTSKVRFGLGIKELMSGIDLVPLLMGLFGISEVLITLEKTIHREIAKTKFRNIFPTLSDWMSSRKAIIRGTIIGFFLRYSTRGRCSYSFFYILRIGKKIF